MKKSCENCVALEDTDFRGICNLEYKTGRKNYKKDANIWNKINLIYGYAIPLEQCPKPLTIKKYIELRNKLK